MKIRALIALYMLAFAPAQTTLAMGRESVETEASAVRPSLFAAGEAKQATGTSRDGWANNPAVLSLIDNEDVGSEFGFHTSALSASDVDGWVAGGFAAFTLHPLTVQLHGWHLSLDGKAPVGQLRWRASEVGITSALALDWLHAPRFSIGGGISVLVDHEMRYRNAHERVSIHNQQPVKFSVGTLYNGDGWRIGASGIFDHVANSHETMVDEDQVRHKEKSTSDDAAIAIGGEVQPLHWLSDEYAELLTFSVDLEWMYRSIAHEGDDKGVHEKYGLEVLLPQRLNPAGEIVEVRLVGGYRRGCFGEAWGIGAALTGRPNTAWSRWGLQFGYSDSEYRHQNQSDIFDKGLEMIGVTLILKL